MKRARQGLWGIGLALLLVLAAGYTGALHPAGDSFSVFRAQVAAALTLVAAGGVALGARRSGALGLMFAAYSVLDKCANGGGAFVAGAILSFISFPPHATPGSVPQDVLQHMAYVQLPIVILFNLTSMVFLARYSLTRADHERNAAILAARRADEAGPMPPTELDAARGAA